MGVLASKGQDRISRRGVCTAGREGTRWKYPGNYEEKTLMDFPHEFSSNCYWEEHFTSTINSVWAIWLLTSTVIRISMLYSKLYLHRALDFKDHKNLSFTTKRGRPKCQIKSKVLSESVMVPGKLYSLHRPHSHVLCEKRSVWYLWTRRDEGIRGHIRISSYQTLIKSSV